MNDAIRVLIIDDSEDDRQVYRRLLQKGDGPSYNLSEAESGEQGVACIEKSVPDCLLLDYSLPGHDGIEVLKRIRAKHLFLPVVMLTGQGNESIAVSAMNAGAQNYLSKSTMNSANIQQAVCVAIEHCALQKRIRSTELQLRQAQKLDAVGQLAGGIAHDFNNLLTVIIGNLELLKDAIPPDPRCERMVVAALRAGESSAKLTHKLLSFSRQQPVDAEVRDVAELVAGMEDMFRRTLGESINVTTAAPPGLWLTRVNEADFENALLNLAINSRDAMPGGGNLTIVISGEFLDEQYAAKHPHVKPGEYIAVAVSDTGTGIPKHQLERVFEPFFTTKEVGKGTGLGLSMCYGFVKQSGGHIDVYSEEGRGTTVRMYLPRWDGQTLERLNGSEHPAEAAAQHSPKVLIVDDNDDVRQVGVETLNALNCRVIEARDGTQALLLLEEHDIDVLFTDLVMPGMNGIVLAAEARKRRPNLRVIFGSGFTAAATVGSQGLDPDEVFIAKPYRKMDLAKKLQGVLKRRETA